MNAKHFCVLGHKALMGINTQGGISSKRQTGDIHSGALSTFPLQLNPLNHVCASYHFWPECALTSGWGREGVKKQLNQSFLKYGVVHFHQLLCAKSPVIVSVFPNQH